MKGSYQLNSFTENKTSEVIRLHSQVDLFFEKEFEIYRKFGLKDGMRIIECGSGPGYLLKNIMKKLPGCNATALEVDSFLVEFLEENSIEGSTRLYEVKHASIYETGLPENTFDFAITRLVIEHLQNPLAALREIFRILKPGGKLVIVSNDFAYHLITYPVIPELDEMYKAYCKSRFSEGGNPLAARQIPKFLRKTGYSAIGLEVVSVHSELVGDKALLQAENVNISKSLVSEGFLSKETLDQLAAAWYDMLKDPDHVIYRQLFMVCGEKDALMEMSVAFEDVSGAHILNAGNLKNLQAGTEISAGEFLKNHVKRIMGDNNLVIDDRVRLCDIDIDSIGAAELSSIIKSSFNRSISITDILQKYSIDDITRIILQGSSGKEVAVDHRTAIFTETIKPETDYEISGIQEQFWILNRIYPQGAAYNIPSLLKIDGEINTVALGYAINRLIERHEVLRSGFYQKDEKVYQRVFQDSGKQFSLEVTRTGEPLNGSFVNELISKDVHTPFNLSEWPLFRIRLVAGKGESLLVIVFHHIIIDLRSREVFSEELSLFYNSFLAGIEPVIQKSAGKYSEYSGWLAKWLESDEAAAKIQEWKNELQMTSGNLQLPSDYVRPKIDDQPGKRKHFYFDQHDSSKISYFAEARSVNPFTVFLAAYSIFLHRISGQKQISVGVPLTNRRKAEFADTLGCFVNIVPVVLDFAGDLTCNEMVNQARQALLRVHRKQEVPFLRINEVGRNNVRNSLFQAGFTMEKPMTLSLEGLNVQPLEIDKLGSQLDLFFTLWPDDSRFSGYMEYNTGLFKDETAERFTGIYKLIVRSMLENPDMPVSEMNILTPEDTSLILDWNETDHDYTEDICIHQVLERQVRKTPDATAIISGDLVLSYSQFNAHVNRLANYLVNAGVQPGDIVCVSMERSPELVIGIYAVHKAGAAYLPVDPGYPPERIGMILADARPIFVLTKRSSERNIPEGTIRIFLDEILSSPLSDNATPPSVKVKSDSLAYLIYTSGSTGKPKGVMIEHRSVINKLEWMQHQHPLDSSDTIMLKTPVTFDVSAWELFWWIFNGARLAILPPGGEKDPKTIIGEIETRKVTAIVFVPSMFEPFVGYIRSNHLAARIRTIKWIIQIGEALSPSLVNSFNELRTQEFNPLLVNTYGPTEATIAVSWYNCPAGPNIEKIYIGKPVFNTKLLVLNDKNRIQPVGVPGELVITGVNLARGYLNRPELNSERFIFFEYSDGRMLRGYRTGDLVKWVNDGNLEFLGRMDSQVKIRGYRIELGDIESALNGLTGVRSSAVIVRDKDPENKYIVGYVTLNEKDYLTPEETRKLLLKKLPEYMIPSHIIVLENMPLNNSGKIDRKSLPEPVLASDVRTVAPASFLESKLLNIFRKTLKIENIGITHNFFDIGGNSLLAIRVVNEIRENLDIPVEPIHVMEFPDIRRLAGFLASTDSGVKQVPFDNTRKQDFSRLQEKRRM